MNQKVVVCRSRERWSELLTEWNSKTRGVAVLPGRNDLPYALLELHTSGVFAQEDARDLDVLPIALEDAWTSAEFPSRAIDPGTWYDMFEEVGFLHNGQRERRPETVPTLYRAAVVGVAGLSWTESLEQAEWFHNRNLGWGLPALLLQRDDTDRFDVLAHFHSQDDRAEHEWVVLPAEGSVHD